MPNAQCNILQATLEEKFFFEILPGFENTVLNFQTKDIYKMSHQIFNNYVKYAILPIV
jgi:hypothetical protein